MENSKKYKISVVIPCYNDGKYLPEAVASVKKCEDICEIIIVDDGSEDKETLIVLKNMEENGCRVLHVKHSGQSAARNTGVRAVSSEYLLFLDADNKIHPEYIFKGTKILNEMPGVGVVYGDREEFGLSFRTIKYADFDISEILFFENFVDACSILRKKVWEDCEGFDERLDLWEDWEFFINAYSKGWKFYHIPEVMYFYRIKKCSVNQKQEKRSNRVRILGYAVAKHAPIFAENFEKRLLPFSPLREMNLSNPDIYFERMRNEELSRRLKNIERSITFKALAVFQKLVDIVLKRGSFARRAYDRLIEFNQAFANGKTKFFKKPELKEVFFEEPYFEKRINAEENSGKKFNLIMQYYDANDAERQKEIDECLKRNCDNLHIKNIYILAEKELSGPLLKNPKIKQILLGRRLKFSDVFSFANNALRGELCLACNADIFFDGSLKAALEYDLRKNFLAITRHNVFPDGKEQLIIGEPKYGNFNIQKAYDSEGGNLAWSSQDAWVFKSPIKNKLVQAADFELGRLHCDCHLAWSIKASGYGIENPCLKVKVLHLHNLMKGIARENFYEHVEKQIEGERYPVNPDSSSWPADIYWVRGNSAAGKIKMYLFCSPSHQVLADDYFLPSIKDDYFIIMEKNQQHCPSANFESEGWDNATLPKIDIIINAIKENWGGIFIHSDVDIQFFGKTKEILLNEIRNKDIVFQKDAPLSFKSGAYKNGIYCSGFLIARANEKTLELYQNAKRIFLNKDKYKFNDQEAVNYQIQKSKKKLRVGFLPSCFYGPGSIYAGDWKWEPGMHFKIPKDIVMHHANWTVGIENKIKQLEYVKNVVFKNRNYF